MARLILTRAGEDVDVGGDVTVFGTTAGGEVITVYRGNIVLDPSFNLGGDTIRLPDDAAFFTVRLVGATALLVGLDISVTIPVGTAGLQVSFNDVSRTLFFDTGSATVRLGEQVVTATLAKVLPAGGAPTLTGTEGADTIVGTGENDVIDGLGGADIINGGAGNDVLRGGAGGDDLDGSFGSDQIFGGPDADRIYDNEGASAYLDGGTGNDWISIENSAGTSFEVVGGDGDDLIDVAIGAVGTCTISAGAGADRVVIGSEGIAIKVALGSGRDQLVLGEFALDAERFGVTTLTDFQAGQFGDSIEFVRALSTFTLNWDQSGNPFGSGHLRLIERDGATVLQVDRDGSAGQAHSFQDMIVFSGVAAAALTRDNLEGFTPSVSAAAGESFSAAYGLDPEAAAMVGWQHHHFA